MKLSIGMKQSGAVLHCPQDYPQYGPQRLAKNQASVVKLSLRGGLRPLLPVQMSFQVAACQIDGADVFW